MAYPRVNKSGTVEMVEAEVPEVEVAVEQLSTRDWLRAQPKVSVRIKKEYGDVPVQINGYTVVIQAGVRVEVPQQIAEMLEAADII